MTKPIYVLNGPNLNRLGKREPQIYGTTTLAEVEAMCRQAAAGYAIEFRQTNAEHQLVDWIQEAIDQGAGIIINPAGLTFRSIPIMDALKMFPGPIFELHISNVHRREAIYHDSLISAVATAVIMGLGPDGYPTAVAAMVRLLGRG
jgi:3-dehydroquinate dehydratase-2